MSEKMTPTGFAEEIILYITKRVSPETMQFNDIQMEYVRETLDLTHSSFLKMILQGGKHNKETDFAFRTCVDTLSKLVHNLNDSMEHVGGYEDKFIKFAELTTPKLNLVPPEHIN